MPVRLDHVASFIINANNGSVKYWEIIIEKLRNAGWNCGCISSTDHKGRQFWVVAAERSHAGRFTVRAGEMRTAFLELHAAIYRRFEPQMESHA